MGSEVRAFALDPSGGRWSMRTSGKLIGRRTAERLEPIRGGPAFPGFVVTALVATGRAGRVGTLAGSTRASRGASDDRGGWIVLSRGRLRCHPLPRSGYGPVRSWRSRRTMECASPGTAITWKPSGTGTPDLPGRVARLRSRTRGSLRRDVGQPSGPATRGELVRIREGMVLARRVMPGTRQRGAGGPLGLDLGSLPDGTPGTVDTNKNGSQPRSHAIRRARHGRASSCATVGGPSLLRRRSAVVPDFPRVPRRDGYRVIASGRLY